MTINIAVIDSGAGGLSIAAKLRQQCAEANIITVADSAFYPYGNKSVLEVSNRVSGIVRQLVMRMQVDAVVVACNTASTIVLESLRSEFDFPVIGVVPAIKPAATRSITKVIGLLATPATIERDYVDQLVSQFASDCRVYRYGSSQLVSLAETFARGGRIDFALALAEVEVLLNMAKTDEVIIDQVVLGCTHFPHFTSYFSQKFPHVNFLDSTDAIVSRVLKVTNYQEKGLGDSKTDKFFSHFETVNDDDRIVFEQHDPAVVFPNLFQA